MLRLVAYAPDGVRRFPLQRAEMLIGSAPECDLCLPYSGVALQHARLRFEGEALRIEDLGSRRGLLVSGRKVREAAREVLDEVRIGNVTLLVEDIAPQPERASAAEAETEAEAEAAEAAGPAAGAAAIDGVAAATGDTGAGAADRRRRAPRMSSERMVDHLTRISEWVLADTESRVSSESLIAEVLAELGGGVLFLLVGEMEQPGVKLVVATDPLWLGKGDELLDQVRAHRNAGQGGNGAAFTGELAGAASWLCYHTFTALDR
ncbi:MAG: FHA domain-containing protein, partial [Acidobacteria bacterium]|nr:FHA domain-containing protein [Acidobacteriota bacterium]